MDSGDLFDKKVGGEKFVLELSSGSDSSGAKKKSKSKAKKKAKAKKDGEKKGRDFKVAAEKRPKEVVPPAKAVVQSHRAKPSSRVKITLTKPPPAEGMGAILGKGSYGVVVADAGHATKNYENIGSFLVELTAYRALDTCSHVLAWKKFSIEGRQIGIAQAQANLGSYIRDNSITYQDSRLSTLLIDVLQGLYQMHSLGVVHADIKSANILVIDGRAYVCDLGLSGCIGKAKIRYTSPPVAEGRNPKPDPAYDMFSFGCLLLRFVVRWDESHPLPESLIPHLQHIPSSRWKKIAKHCIDANRSSRWTAGQCLEFLGVQKIKPPPVDFTRFRINSDAQEHYMQMRLHRADRLAMAYEYILQTVIPPAERQRDYLEAVAWVGVCCFHSSATIHAFTKTHVEPHSSIFVAMYDTPQFAQIVFLG